MIDEYHILLNFIIDTRKPETRGQTNSKAYSVFADNKT